METQQTTLTEEQREARRRLLFDHEEYHGANHWKDYVCPICNTTKSICMQREYVYRIGVMYYCSYTCWRKAKETKKQEKKRNFVKYY